MSLDVFIPVTLRWTTHFVFRSICAAKRQLHWSCKNTNIEAKTNMESESCRRGSITPLLFGKRRGYQGYRTDTRKGKSRPMGPPVDRLPLLLDVSGMAGHCLKPENRLAPLIALDVAPSNFGIAISNKAKTRAFPLKVVDRLDSTETSYGKSGVPSMFVKLQDVIDKHHACGLVVGWPISKAGIAEMECIKILRFLSDMMLKGEITLPVTLYDERCTTAIALSKLKKHDGLQGDDEIAGLVNQTAAMFILRRFLHSKEFLESTKEGEIQR